MANEIGRQTADWIKTGKAKVYAQLISESGVALGPARDIGNVAEATLAVETEETTIRTGEDDNPVPVRSRKRITGATLTLTCRNQNEFVDTTSLQGDLEEFVQLAVPNGSYTYTGAVKDQDTFKLPHEAVTVTAVEDADGTELELNTHYKVDRGEGRVKIVGLPVGYTTGLVVTYSAIAQTVKQIAGYVKTGGTLCRIVVRETAEGPQGAYTFFRTRGVGDGDKTLIAADSDDPVETSLAFTLEQDETQDVNDGLFRYRKMGGSI